MKTKSAAKILCSITLLILAGCQRNHFITRSSQVLEEHTFVKALYSAPLTFDPILMNDTASLIASNLMYDGLLKFSSYMELQSGLAESWATDDSGKTITFKLKPNIYFHDGQKIKAQDVVASLSRAVSKKSVVYKYYECIDGASSYHDGRSKSVKGLRAINEQTVTITLKYPFPPFLSVLAGGTAKILPASADTNKDFFKFPNGSGPYKFEYQRKEAQQTDLHFSKFEKYHSKIETSEIVLRALDEKLASEQASRGEIHDLANFPLTGNEPIFKMGKNVNSPAAWTWIIGLNTRLAPFKNLKIRSAFKASIDTEGFRKMFYPDAAPAYGYFPPGLPGYKTSPKLEKPENIEPSSIKIKIAIPGMLANQTEMRKYLESNLNSKGWNVEFIPMEWDALMKGYNDKTLQGFLVAMNIDYPDAEFLVRNFESNNPDNFSGLSDPKIDKLIRQARHTTDRIEREKLYLELVDLINAASVSVNLFHPRSHYWVNKCVRGFEPNLLSDVYIDYTKVGFNSSCKTQRLGANL